MRKARHILRFVPILFGAALLSYPVFVDQLYNSRQAVMVDSYQDKILGMDDIEKQQCLQIAMDYNAALCGVENGDGNPYTYESIYEILAVNGILGSLEIPQIGLRASIYPGTSPDTLRKGIGHLEYTSLPTGGEDAHSVLTAHNGGTAKLFTHLDQLDIGDRFFLYVLGKTMVYEVDQMKIVAPDDASDLAVIPGMDYVTLVTCSPYGVNSFRLLVRGHRVPYSPEEKQQIEDTYQRSIPWQYIVSVSAVVLYILVYSCRQCAGKDRKGDKS